MKHYRQNAPAGRLSISRQFLTFTRPQITNTTSFYCGTLACATRNMRLAYNTNGLAHNDLFDAIELLADIGYKGISITLDHGILNPYDDSLEEQMSQVSDALAARNL